MEPPKKSNPATQWRPGSKISPVVTLASGEQRASEPAQRADAGNLTEAPAGLGLGQNRRIDLGKRARIAAHEALVPHGDVPESPRVAANPYGARGNRERRADADGLPVYRLRYRRKTV